MIFNHFRQPKDALLGKYVNITDDGKFEAIGGKNSQKLAFGSMLNTRISLIYCMPYYLSRMATIATRYSFLRRQFEGKDGANAPETPVMLYQMQQFKIIPTISLAWALQFSINKLYGLNEEYQ